MVIAALRAYCIIIGFNCKRILYNLSLAASCYVAIFVATKWHIHWQCMH